MWFYALVFVTSLSGISKAEIGSCPPTLSVDVCEASCNLSKPCNETQLCCPTVCGGAMCVDAMTKRHFIHLVKSGRCPDYPGGVWVCSNRCTGDSDCPRALKCCPNRCGALACQRPEPEPVLEAGTGTDAPNIDARNRLVTNDNIMTNYNVEAENNIMPDT